MYNRYIPDWESQPSYRPGPERGHASAGRGGSPPPFRLGGLSDLWPMLSREGLGKLLRPLGLEELDGGDLLLLLILILILTEGEDLEPAIALGLVVLMVVLDGKDSAE